MVSVSDAAVASRLTERRRKRRPDVDGLLVATVPAVAREEEAEAKRGSEAHSGGSAQLRRHGSSS